MRWPRLAGAALALSAPNICLPQEAPERIEPIRSSITVAERVSTEAPAAITVWSPRELGAVPGVNLDDRLRLIPGFSLFRRTSSLVANPTTQGVSLRGLGSTGASRTLVLWDGIPLNDPFGGWVYWTRVAPEELDRIEASRGASTSVFGDRAMGGTLALLTREPAARRLTGSYEGGNLNTHEVTGGGSAFLGSQWAISGSARAFTTDGYFLVPEESRGPIDTRANVRFAGGVARADWLGGSQRLFTRFDMLAEERDNGTQVQRNSTSLGTVAAHYTHQLSTVLLSALGYHSRGEYRASFSAIGAGRLTERLTTLQSVPAEASGGAVLVRAGRRSWNAVAGADVNRSEGYSLETLLPAGSRAGGGTQWQHGLFVQGDAVWRAVRLFGGLRRHMTGSREFWSPSGGMTVGGGSWRVRASGYRAFRAPTLNELYRDFRAGNALTQANPALRPETLTGVEAGADWRGESTSVSLTVFRNELGDLITNVTRSVTSSLIVRQRDNASAALVRGAEAAVRKSWGRWRAEGAWLYADSRFATGERVPQVPRNQGSGQLVWSRQGTLLAGGVRGSDLQFEDDRNAFRLPGYAVWFLSARQQVRGPLSVHCEVENLLDHKVIAGYSPTPLLASPRMIRAGLRIDWN